MKLLRLLSLPILFVAMVFTACSAQNGPTQPSVKLSWTQSTSAGLTGNCVYRGNAAGVYTLPALFCSPAPITGYTDTTVQRGITYNYAVTAKAYAIEGAYSNNVTTPIPTAPNAPTLNSPAVITRLIPGQMRLEAKVIWNK